MKSKQYIFLTLFSFCLLSGCSSSASDIEQNTETIEQQTESSSPVSEISETPSQEQMSDVSENNISSSDEETSPDTSANSVTTDISETTNNSDSSIPTEKEIEIYNYVNELLEIGPDTSQNPSSEEIATALGISTDTINENYKAYKQVYLESTYESYCTQLTAEKYGISTDEVDKIFVKVFSYEN